jgi:hypothetical protein
MTGQGWIATKPEEFQFELDLDKKSGNLFARESHFGCPAMMVLQIKSGIFWIDFAGFAESESKLFPFVS